MPSTMCAPTPVESCTTVTWFATRLLCPVHLAAFNVKTGELTEGPKCETMRTYPVRMDGEHIEVGIEEQ